MSILMKLTLTLILVIGARYVRSGRSPLASGSMGIQVGVLSCWGAVQEGTNDEGSLRRKNSSGLWDASLQAGADVHHATLRMDGWAGMYVE